MTEYRQVGTEVGRLSSKKDGAVATASVPFSVIKHAVAKQFEIMKQHTLFRVDLSGAKSYLLPVNEETDELVRRSTMSPEQRAAETGDRLWEAYLAAFPEGTNPIFRERTDHDCSCCKHFIRTMGGVVAIVDGKVMTLWDFEPTDTYYDAVASALDNLVINAPIDNIFLHTEKSVGTGVNFQQLVDHGTAATTTLSWEHFHLHLPASVVVKKDAVGPRQSDASGTFDVFKRGLDELTLDALDTMLELTAQNSLYKGEEFKGVVEAFMAQKVAYDKVGMEAGNASEVGRLRDAFIWSSAVGPAVKRLRNSAIGTLLIDLSEGLEMEQAVAKYEKVVAPSNYKRPTALVTKAMIAKAASVVEALGLTSALERRYATIDDITVNNVLFADRNVRPTFKSSAFGAPYGKDVFAALSDAIHEKPRNLDKVEEISIEKFLADVLPKAQSLEVLFENRHAGNLVSLIAPVDPGAKTLFKWPNNFSWSYSGDVTDSIKERVKKAGGSVVGDLCCRLAWDYTDDLDFHMVEPDGYRIYFGCKRQLSPSGGMLDLDANGGDGMKADPAENIFYANKGRMMEGTYTLIVNNYSRRGSGGVGFDAQVEFDGTTHTFHYDRAINTSGNVTVARIEYSKKNGFKLTSDLPTTTASKEVWGLQTETYRKVETVMLSPNYWWDEAALTKATRGAKGQMSDLSVMERGGFGIGNKHFFFMLEGCRNAEKARGFYNEFLDQRLDEHRKTLEMVGTKMKTDESDRQLSGLGFSSTQRNSVLVRVKGSFNRVVKVVI